MNYSWQIHLLEQLLQSAISARSTLFAHCVIIISSGIIMIFITHRGISLPEDTIYGCVQLHEQCWLIGQTCFTASALPLLNIVTNVNEQQYIPHRIMGLFSPRNSESPLELISLTQHLCLYGLQIFWTSWQRPYFINKHAILNYISLKCVNEKFCLLQHNTIQSRES